MFSHGSEFHVPFLEKMEQQQITTSHCALNSPPSSHKLPVYSQLSDRRHKDIKVKYNGDGMLEISHSNSIIAKSDACIQSKHKLKEITGVGYFEMKVIEFHGTAAIGLANANYPRNKQPGWVDESYGFHGDDGHKFHNSGSGAAYGPTFGAGDTVGCGCLFRSRQIFFTLNGRYLGIAFSNICMDSTYPTIGLDRATVLLNFGEKKFCFDIQSLEEEEKNKEKNEIMSVTINPTQVTEIIRNYLHHEGFQKTLEAFDSSIPSGAKMGTIPNHQLMLRKEIKEYISNGLISEAMRLISERIPDFLVANPYSSLLLEIQCFVEHIREGNTSKAIELAQSNLSKLLDLSQRILDEQVKKYPHKKNYIPGSIDDVVGLLAYTDPRNSPLHHFLDLSRRHFIAEEINSEITVYMGGKRSSSIEKVIAQMFSAYKFIRSEA